MAMVVAERMSFPALTMPARSHPTPRRRRYRACIIAVVAAIAIFLAVSAPTASASGVQNKCIQVNEDYDLRNAARDSNVFVIVHEPDNKEARENICNKLEGTPVSRINDASKKGKDTVFAYMEIKESKEDYDGVWQEGNRNFATTSLGVKSFPSFLYVSKGMDRTSKFSNHITHYKSKGELDLADVTKFIEKMAGFRIGNDVYNIIFFDSVASRFVSYGDATGMDRYKQRLLALLVRFSTLFSFKEPFTSIGKLYNRAFAMSFENGMDYSVKQVEKLQKKLDSNQNNLSQDKIHEFQQKKAILISFSEPKELTAEDDKQIFIHIALHLGLIIATILIFIVPSDEPDEAGEEDGEEVINAQPVVAKVVEESEADKSSKKTK
ncbi:hypothetical protein ACHAWF_015833 [Thalassiosira exigua]